MLDWLDKDDIVHFIIETVETLDLSAFDRNQEKDTRGHPGLDPRICVLCRALVHPPLSPDLDRKIMGCRSVIFVWDLDGTSAVTGQFLFYRVYESEKTRNFLKTPTAQTI